MNDKLKSRMKGMRTRTVHVGMGLGSGVGLISLMIIAITVLALTAVARLDRQLEHVVNEEYARIALLGEMRQTLMRMAIVTRDIALDRNTLSPGIARLRDAQQRYVEYAKALRPHLVRAGAGSAVRAIDADAAEARLMIRKAALYAEQKRLHESIALLTDVMRPAQERWLQTIEAMIKRQEMGARSATRDALAAYAQTRFWILVSACTAALVSTAIVWFTAGGTVQSLREAGSSCAGPKSPREPDVPGGEGSPHDGVQAAPATSAGFCPILDATGIAMDKATRLPDRRGS